MPPIALAEDIFWVGVVDWDVREFHGYNTPRGSTYNSYLIRDEKTCVVDGVRAGFESEMLRRVRACCGDRPVDYLVVNHVEPDHSGGLPRLVEELRPRKIVASKRGREALALHYESVGFSSWDVMTVATGDEISLGAHTLSFLEAPMLHWPDSMFTYVKEAHVLLPNDAFGQHLASGRRFADELERKVVMEEALAYYANILMPFADQILRIIQKVGDLGLEIDAIGPSHGVIWRRREDVDAIIESYAAWARFEAVPKVVIVYDTMWHSTEKMARAIADGVADENVDVTILRLAGTPLAQVMSHIQECRAFVVGSPTLNNGVFPTVGRFLTYVKGLRPRRRLTGAFGSFGWGGGAVKEIDASLRAMGLEVVDPLEIRYVPSEEQLGACEEYGRQVAQRVKGWS